MSASSAIVQAEEGQSVNVEVSSNNDFHHESQERKTGTESQEEKTEDRRLWVGNLDPKLTEFQLLKLVQRFGPIDNFDFLFHRTGPNAGLPRGYAFITYKTSEAAQRCQDELSGKKILGKTISVRYAHQTSYIYTDEEEKLRKKLPALGMKLEAEPAISKERTISAIEAKLKAMERDKEEHNNFNLTAVGAKPVVVPSRSSPIIHYPYASKAASSHQSYDAKSRSKPYSRTYPRKRF